MRTLRLGFAYDIHFLYFFNCAFEFDPSCFCKTVLTDILRLFCLSRLFGKSFCSAAYRKLSFTGTPGINRLKKDIATTVHIASHPEELDSDDEAPDGLPFPQKPAVASAVAIAFLSQLDILEATFGEQMPHIYIDLGMSGTSRNVVYIPCGLFKDKSEFIRWAKDQGLIPNMISERYYRELWRKHRPHIQIRRNMPFGQCSTCGDFRLKLKQASHDPEKTKKVMRHQEMHRVECKYYRERMHMRMSLAVDYPLWFMMIMLDGMDQRKTQHPAEVRPTKDIEGLGDPLATRFVGA